MGARYFLAFLFVFNLILCSGLISDYFSGKLAWDRTITNYNFTQYLVSYNFEFLKRGFLASVFDSFGISINKITVFVYSYLVVNAVFIAIWKMVNAVFNRPDQKKMALVFMGIFVLSPATAVQFGNDFGRLDPSNILVMLLSIWIVLYKSEYWILVLIPTLSSIAVLIHEIYIFTGLPLVLAAMYLRSNQLNLKMAFAVLMGTVFLVMLGILFFGNADYQFTIDYLTAQTGFTGEEFPIAVWTSSLFQNLSFTFERYEQAKTWTSFLRDLSVLLPYVLLIWFAFRNKNLNRPTKLVLFAPLAILPLFLIGIDFSRWMGLIILNFMIAFLIAWHHLKPEIEDKSLNKRYLYLGYFTMLVGFVVVK